MRLKSGTYRVLWEAHAWAGATASVLLVGMFLLGVASLFRHELEPWQEPRLRTPLVVDEARTMATLQQWMDTRVERGSAPAVLNVVLPAPYAPWLGLGWKEKDGSDVAVRVNPLTGEEVPERSDLGEFLFHLHFLYPLPGGMFIAGLVATVLLLVVGTGLVLQVGRFRRELVRFRPREALRTAWGDLHKVLGSVGLPFQAVMAWTAAIICLNATVMRPVMIHTAFDGDVGAGLASTGYPGPLKRAGEAAPAPDVAKALEQARVSLPGVRHYRFAIRNLGDTQGFVDVRGYARQGLHEFTSVRVSRTGEVLNVRPAGGPGPSAWLLEGAYVLHSGLYAGMGLRLVYALLGVLSALCVLTGNLIWLERRARGMRRVDVGLARLTAGGFGGAAFALAAVFLANQLLPDSLSNRPAWEHATFYGAWCLCVLGAPLYPRATEWAYGLLALAGGILVLLPGLDAWRNARPLLAPAGSPYVFFADLAFLFLGALFLVSAWVVRRMAPSEPEVAAAPLNVPATEQP
ncbi:PepSY-associated TM helix domain-containing protein [Myxococcus landrumensis]|uniref:PepSY domain-containing protein n=1 Tax=Myxococcus landrumensis TaxID=2813577 RepID=A0ABX7NFG0_9BACT|nr:PepSY-associated TM helix domain-containing protein [Myxococcus landrumus]QSQ17550.1 PepSY domain-containing protein [Myxococcus landrumus]